MSNRQLLVPALLSLALTACVVDEAAGPTRPRVPTATIVDGARGGNAHFYWLPPMVGPTTYGGAFDSTASPVVHICAVTGSGCGAMIAQYSLTSGVGTDTLRRDVAAEHYHVHWNTADFSVDTTTVYRVAVKIGSAELGYADIRVVANKQAAKNVDTNQEIPLVDGKKLNIKFRVEQGAVRAERIAFVSTRDGNAEIYTMSTDGSGLTRVTNTANAEGYPDWSPVGRRLAFQRAGVPGLDAEIVLVNEDGTSESMLPGQPGDDAAPSWNPTGTRLAYQNRRPGFGPYGIFTADANGSGETFLYRVSGLQTEFPDWSPAGDSLAFFVDLGNSACQGADIYVGSSTGGPARQLTHGYVDYQPRWSPDGSKLVFWRMPLCGGRSDVYVVNRDGTGLAPLTSAPYDNVEPFWSADGAHIVYASNRSGSMQVHVMRADGTNDVQLTSGPGTNRSPAWSR